MSKSSLTLKIAISLIFSLLILVTAAWITKRNSSQISLAVNQLSAPNMEQDLYNSLFKNIVLLNQMQHNKVLVPLSKTEYQYLDTLENGIRLNLDSLQRFNANNPEQLERLLLLDTLLHQRKELMIVYEALNKDFVKSDSLQVHINRLSEFIGGAYLRSDTSLFKKESSISTSTFADSSIVPEEEKRSTIWNRLFGKKKEPVTKEVRYFVLEQMNVSLDTLQLMQDDSIIMQLTQSLDGLQTQRQNKLTQLRSQRYALDEANSTLILEVISTLDEIESNYNQVLQQQKRAAVTSIDDTLNSITILIIVFLVLILILGALIARDLVLQAQNKAALIEAKEEADRLGMVKQQFLSKMSHELRSPLQSIIGYSDLMLQTEPNRNQVQVVANASHHLLEIVNQILDYNKLIDEQTSIVAQPFSLGLVLEEIKALITIQAQQKNIAFTYDISQEIAELTLIGDKMRYKQILLNILHNGIKFTEKGSMHLQLQSVLKGDIYTIKAAIKDTGHGIPQNQLVHIFKVFEQLPSKQMPEGSGLGLSIAKELTEKMGGNITVASEEGKGSIFVVEISFAKGTLHEQAKKQQAHKLQKQQGSVWVVDDDAYILELCHNILNKNNMPFETFPDPHKVLVAAIPADLKWVFIDIRMPGMMGYELVKLLRGKIQHPVTYVALTAQVLPDEVANIQQLGFDEVLLKPFNIAAFEAYFMDPFAENSAAFLQDEQLKNAFIDATNKDHKSLIQGMMLGDTVLLYETCHKLSSRLSQLGYEDLGNKCRILEAQFKEQKLPLQSLQQFIQELQELLNNFDDTKS